MERRFDMSDFEQSLKDHADQFKLMPSKRVWKGIYNDLHPGSKWPSITVGLIFLITLVSIGNFNNKSYKTVSKEKTAFLSSANKETTTKINRVSQANNSKETLKSSGFENNSVKNNTSKSTNNVTSSLENVKNSDLNNSEITGKKNSSFNNTLNNASKNIDAIITANSLKTLADEENNVSNEKSSPILLTYEAQNLSSIVPVDQEINSYNTEISEPLPSIERISYHPQEFNLFTSENSANNLVSKTQAVALTKETNIAKIKKALRKMNKNTEWTFYVSPDISTVSFDNKSIHPSVSTNSASIVVLPNQVQPSLLLVPNPRIGFETGAEVKTLVAKNLKVVSGFNINYSSYNTVSNIVHPTIATLILTNRYGTYSKDYITYYGNGQTQSGHVTLTNYSVQLSVPVGFEYTIWGNKKVAIDVQSVIEPSVVLKSNAYLLSSDGRYYVNDPSMIRKINLEGNFGTFVSFSSSKIRWHVGPDIRYQFLSSYKNNYSTKEHFIDYGIRIGLSRVK